MPSQTNEQALEAAIEKHLTGSCQEERKTQNDAEDAPSVYRSGKGYYAPNPPRSEGGGCFPSRRSAPRVPPRQAARPCSSPSQQS